MFSSCASHLNKFEKRDSYYDNSSVLGLNAINADYNYYTKAILEYLLVKEIVDGNSKIFDGTPKYEPKSKSTVTQIALFPKLKEDFDIKINNNETINKLKEKGIKYCYYDLPKKLSDLESGFQFNHYVFKSTNRAAMQAFGIVDSEVKSNSLYIITDYLQYKDINCTGIPTIRYAVGMRAQFRISETTTESELKGVGSLAGLAAQVETNQKNVNITIKTIGITGVESRLSIPSNTSFDVKTYSDYEKILEFIRNMKDTSNKDAKEIIINPQIIPVMDDYRTTVEHTFHPLYESIELLETKLKEMEDEDGINLNAVSKIKKEITDIKLDLVFKEVQELKRKRETLILGNRVINDYSVYTNLLSILNGLHNNPDEILEEIKDKLNLNLPNEPKFNSYQLNENKDSEKAKTNELNGFNDLLNEDIYSAINHFIISENSSNGYNQVYEISKFLKKKEKTKTKDLEFWKQIYSEILINYSYNIPSEVEEKIAYKFLEKNNLKNIKIYNLGLNSDTVNIAYESIKGFFPKTEIKNLDSKPTWFSDKSSILWYDKSSIPIATAIKYILQKDLKSEIKVEQGGGYGVSNKNKLNEFRIHLMK